MKTLIAGASGMASVVPARSGGVRDWQRWMIGLAGGRVPIALAVVPASLISVLLIVGGIGIWSGLDQMVANLVATLGCYYQRRGPCSVCGRGVFAISVLH